ncbi:MAG: cellulase family glycosylhydrolase [Fibromonadaceae bacterium]|jgi:hypothetical protein|nr:cellulase family glycosylhydrolase [Fibromonadaceae bacterium]
MKIFVLAFLLLAIQTFAGPVSHFGALKRCTKNICGSKNGTESTPIQVKGPSLYWSDGSGAPFYNMETVDWFVDNMQIGVIRAAMGIRYYDNGSSQTVNKAGGVAGYYFNPDGQKALMKKVIDAAIANDIYVIVDWHSHQAHNEASGTNNAKDFFVEMANAYKNVPNIIWEVYNEPTDQVSQDQVDSYANTIVSALRSAGNTNLVIIGSPSWSTNPSGQASKWGSKDNNVAFAFHFYAGTHNFNNPGSPPSAGGGSSAQSAMSASNAVFASEWGTVNADGKGGVSDGSSNNWTSWMDDQKISNCMWNASDLDEGSSIFNPGTNTSNMSTSRLSNSGKYFQTYMTGAGKKKWRDYIPSSHPKGNDVVKSIRDGESVTFSSTDLGLDGEISEVSEPEFGTASKTANSITYATSKSGSPSDKVKFFYKITKGGVTVQSKITINITDRKPGLPEIAPIAVSRKAPTDINMISTLLVQDPTGQGVEFSSVSIDPPSMGTVTLSSAKNIATFTPDASQHNVTSAEATLNYTVKAKNGNSSTASVVLKLQNFAPTIRPIGGKYAPEVPNTGPVGFGMGIDSFNGNDKDGDPISFKKFYLAPEYPGSLEQVKPDSLVYYPEAGKIGKVTILAVITDGSLDSPTGSASVTLTGAGTDINVTPPTSIPGVIDPPDPTVVHQLGGAKSLGLAPIGSGKIELYFERSGVAKLDVYSLSGKKLGSLLSGHQNAGSKQVSLGSLNLQKGVYILRLSQGSQVKTLRVVN